ncbi:hypothetical protein Lesp02_50220 [Lentzea sp. NBRC 105346]|uniref:DUF5753 domain-containing protein n=1 Tax=Lentzea sp. NBRC 105346 TaxID=3032205 RepID=UPI0024A5EA93|nr:DUF5753 domain-containing protein [Lentzea sp. NBRC 105346]GLZ32834.1 hypothetical protein Lesp02_50220 [Lentzea sp. NBRC 105346]
MPKRISSVVGREFGNGICAALRDAGLSARRAAQILDWDEAKISALANGKGGSTESEVSLLLGLCHISAADYRRLMALFRESREKGWLQFPESGVPDQVRTLIEQERLANAITVWSLNLVPGLLQVPGYTRVVTQAFVNVHGGNVEELVAARTARREIIDSGRTFTFFVHEQALLLPIGSPETMSDQLHELMRMLIRPNVDLRIVPTAVGVHAGLAGSFTKLAFATFEPIVYQEGLNTSLFLEDKESMAMYQQVLEALDQQALDAEESKELITSIVT